jgi:hypothetical protein
MSLQFGWPSDTPGLIWWSVHDLAIQKLGHLDRIKIQKFIHDQWPTNHRESRYKENIDDQCSACEQEGENEDHIIRCRCKKRQGIREAMLTALETHLKENNTDQTVSAALLLGIHSWLHGQAVPNPKKHFPNASPELWNTFTEQTTIGWRHIIKGRLSTAWGAFINHQYHNNEPIQETRLKSKP